MDGGSRNGYAGAMNTRNDSRAMALAGARIAIGASLVLAPGLAGRIFVGPGADGPGGKVFARIVGGRDVVLGAAVLVALQNGEPVAALLRLGFASDVADALATAVAARNLTPARRFLMPVLAAAAGIAGYLAVEDAPSPR